MKNKSEKIYHFLSFACMVALAAYIILSLHHLTESASYMSGATYKFLVGAELVLLIIVFIRIFWAFRSIYKNFLGIQKIERSRKWKKIMTENCP